jgi:hypothetical protein
VRQWKDRIACTSVGEHWRVAVPVLVRCQLFRWMMDLNSDMLCFLRELFSSGCDRPAAADSGDRLSCVSTGNAPV